MAEEIDGVTAAAILSVQLRDIEEMFNDANNTERVGDEDAALARRIYHEDLNRHAVRLHDHQIATLFGESPMGNEELPLMLPPIFPPSKLRTQALDPVESHPEGQENSSTPQDTVPADAPTQRLLGLDRYFMEQERLSRKRKASHSPPPSRKLARLADPTAEATICTACMDHILSSEPIPLPCGHDYCADCMMRLFSRAMADETLFPPRCCGKSIPLAIVASQVTTEFEKNFHERQIELGTPASERSYCAHKPCSTFLPPEAKDLQHGKVTCPKCHTQTCMTCRGVAHESGYCPKDPSVVSLMATAAMAGYKQCPSCHLLIELTFGCNHM
ncbi:MAG: hypothetical protein Q9226_005780, partial [Calogaya cf. arnoldii]